MGCGASNDTSRVQQPTILNKKSVLPAIEPKIKNKSPSAKSNGSTDSGIEDSEPIKTKPNPSKMPVSAENFHVEHHEKSRLGLGERFDIIAASRPTRLAPLRHVPKFVAEQRQAPTVDPDLEAKLVAKQERASRKRQEIEEARRLASSRIGHRAAKPAGTSQRITTDDPLPSSSKFDERHQQLSMLRDQLRQSGSHNSLYDPMHTPRTPRGDSVSSGMTDIANMTPRRGGIVIGATNASNFKAVYD